VPGQALYMLDVCPENRDESNGNSIVRLWLQFIPIFGALHSQLRKGHTTKKDISVLLAIVSFSGDSIVAIPCPLCTFSRVLFLVFYPEDS